MAERRKIGEDTTTLPSASTEADVPLALADTAAAIAPLPPREPIAVIKIAASFLERLADWDRYRVTRRLGSGGMGEVFHAIDLQLNRPVALKFLLAETEELARRFALEAQAQAHVDHEHVCKVYEVGTALGRCYIAMQFVAGKTLHAAASEMSLEEKMLVAAQVAEGLHAAHRQGLIHRDVKPQNVLVERGEDGAWKPYITDFGLARDLSQTGETASSTAGTPLYMSPEQIRGDVKSFDRRTDVYALGATLYELAVGRVPFDGSVLTLVPRVLNEEPKSLRSIAPSIPHDLDAIVLKCLEKEPERRYETAKALAEDLRRWLDGEPVAARRASALYRAKKLLLRHKALAAVSLAAVVTATSLGVAFARERLVAREAARLGEELGRETEAIDGIMRVSALLPLHDVTPDKALVRARMLAIQKKAEGANDALKSQVAYALGRASFALGEPAEAREHLEAAERGGLHTPGVSYALGLALGELYRRARTEAARLPQGEERKAKERDIDASLRQPALAALRAGAGAARASPAYAEGLLAFFEGRSDEALAKAKGARTANPWLFEAWRLEGDVLLSRAVDEHLKGDLAAARVDLDAAHTAFDAASEVARSDAASYEGDCARAIEVMQLEDAQGGSMREPFESARHACAVALEADPNRVGVLDKQSEAAWRFGDFEGDHGRDPKPHYEEAEKAAASALRTSPRDIEAHRNLTLSLQALATLVRQRGEDDRELLTSALHVGEEGLALDPRSSRLENAVALIHRELATSVEAHGGDPRPEFERAIEHISHAAEIDPRPAHLFNRSTVWESWADYDIAHGHETQRALDRSVEDAMKAAELGAAQPLFSRGVGDALQKRALYAWRRGGDPLRDLQRAIEGYGKALEAKPDFESARLDRAHAEARRARVAMDRGDDGASDLAAARADLAVAIAHAVPEPQRGAAAFEVETVAARAALRAHEDPAPFIEAAKTALDRWVVLVEARSRRPGLELRLARLRAEARFARGIDASEDIERGLILADEALGLDIDKDDTFASASVLLAIRALTVKDADVARQSAKKAIVDLESIENDAPARRESQALVERARHVAE